QSRRQSPEPDLSRSALDAQLDIPKRGRCTACVSASRRICWGASPLPASLPLGHPPPANAGRGEQETRRTGSPLGYIWFPSPTGRGARGGGRTVSATQSVLSRRYGRLSSAVELAHTALRRPTPHAIVARNGPRASVT